MVQWLRLGAPKTGGPGFDPQLGNYILHATSKVLATKILHATTKTQYSQKKKKRLVEYVKHISSALSSTGAGRRAQFTPVAVNNL